MRGPTASTGNVDEVYFTNLSVSRQNFFSFMFDTTVGIWDTRPKSFDSEIIASDSQKMRHGINIT
jgi:hypothetical protein